jgi:protein gp37
MGATSIEWTDHSLNPLRVRDPKTGAVGHYCEKISLGCKNCYASAMQRRFGTPKFPGAPLAATLPIGDNGCVAVKGGLEVFLDESKLQDVLRRRKPTRFFWCDMSDAFGSWVPDEWLDRMFAVMALTPQHTHQVLTKRPERMAEYFATGQGKYERQDMVAGDVAVFADLNGRDPFEEVTKFPWPLPNVWLGTSVENQQQADARIPHLLRTPAAVRFLSCEPLLSRVDLGLRNWANIDRDDCRLGWVITGGESGPGARPCSIDWIRLIIEDCQLAGIPCFNKQLGARPFMDGSGGERFDWPCGYVVTGGKTWLDLKDKKGGDMEEWPVDLRVREFPEVATATPAQ